MRTEFITTSSTEISVVSVNDSNHLGGSLAGELAKKLNREVKQAANEHYLKAFEQKDLSNSFRKYCVEGFVQRCLRRAGFITVGDMLALNETEFHLFISGENQTVQARSLTLYKALQLEKNKIVRHHSRTSENRFSPPALGGSTNPPHEVVSNSVAVGESNLRKPELGCETNDGASVEPGNLETTTANADELLNKLTIGEKQTSLELPPIRLGQVVQRDRFHAERKGKYQELPYSEEGLRRHVLIAGSTGSGKTAAARYIVEQAAISGVPSIVVDAQGDISSLVIEPEQQAASLFDKASFLRKPETRTEEEDLKAKIRKHLDALSQHPGPISGLFIKRCLPRIFTPGRPDLGLPLSLPPYLDILAAYSDESNDEFQQHELGELLSDEVETLVRTILPKLKPEKHKGYVELLVRLFRCASEQQINLDGRAGIKALHQLVQRAQELAPEIFKNYLSDKDQNELSKAIYGLQFYQEQKWFEGQPLDIAALCQAGENNRTPINIINVQELHNPDDKKRVLRQVIAAVYKYGVRNPRHSGPPSLLLYIDEIGTGYGERSVGKPEQTATYQVYRVLNRLVRQARKYGISVMLASQAYTDFNPDLRRQLGTKVIGKVDDRSEQCRVAQSIGEDVIAGARDPREFVQAELPRLGPPRLLCVGVRGEAYTYEQFKCCTLDVILHGRAVRRWREMYQQKTADIIETANHLFQTGCWADALRKLDRIANETCFVIPLHPRVAALRGRCLVRLDRVSEAERIFEQEDSDSSASSFVDLGREIASWYRGNGQREKYVRTLKRTAELAAPLDPKISEIIQLELSKYNLFEARDPSAADNNLEAISKSEDQKVTLFARAWQKATTLFRSWASAWPFVSSTSAGGEVSLFEPLKGQLAVAITVLTVNEEGAKEPLAYESELGKNPEILRISHILDNTTKQRASFSSLGELNSFQLDYQRRLGRAHDFRETGRIRETINELEQLFKLPQIVAPDSQEIKRYDEDPEVRRLRVADWLDGLDWRAFECEVAILFAQMGYTAWATRRNGDGGVDVRALKGNEKLVIQCKHWKRQNVGVEIVQAIHTTKEKENASLAVIVTSANLEPVALREARRCGVEVIEGRKLVDLFAQYCDLKQPRYVPNSNLQLDGDDDRRSCQGELALSDKDDDTDRKILKFAEEKGKVQSMDIQSLIGISRQVAGMRLRKLAGGGYLDMHGTGAAAYYTIS